MGLYYLISDLRVFREEGRSMSKFLPILRSVQMRLVIKSGYYSKNDFLALIFAATIRERLLFKSGG